MESSRERNADHETLTDMTNNVEDLLEFHPEILDAMNDADRDVLSKFFFAGREIDVVSVADYQADLENAEPGITETARAAYGRFMQAAGAK